MWLVVATAWAGAWVPAPGHGYAKLGGGAAIGAESRWTGLSAYVEVGLPAGFALVASAPVGVSAAAQGGVVYRRWAVGDATVGLSRRVLPTASVSVVAKIPGYGDGPLAAYGTLAPRFPQPGDGQVDLDLRADVGRSLRIGAADGWVQVGGGWRHRDGPPVDGVLASAELGVNGPGFAVVRASAVVNPVPDADTDQWLKLGVGVGVGTRTRVEGWIDDTRLASPTARGTSAGLGLSYTW